MSEAGGTGETMEGEMSIKGYTDIDWRNKF
jgi:hypothetical protein